MAKIGVIYANPITVPTIPGYGAEVVCNILENMGHDVFLVDIPKMMYPDTNYKTSEKWKESIRNAINNETPDILAVSMRNASYTYLSSFFDESIDFGSFIPWYKSVADEIKKTGFPLDRVIAGGVGFGTMPNHILNITGIKSGIVGAAEISLEKTVNMLLKKGKNEDIPWLTERGKPFIMPRREYVSSPNIPIKRNFVDNLWYETNGGGVPLSLDNGCLMMCSYCNDPEPKGMPFRKSMDNIMNEFFSLYEQGIRNIHFADSEFNFNPNLKKEFLKRIISNGIGDVKFGVYMQPTPLDEELIRLLANAGCDGINFSSDNIRSELLKDGFNKSWYAKTKENPKDVITKAEELCREYGIRTKHEVMIGLPGDNWDNVRDNLDFFMNLNPHVIGLTVGIGVLPSSHFFKTDLVQKAIFDLREGYESTESLLRKGIYTKGTIGYDGATYYLSPNLNHQEIFLGIENIVKNNKNVRYHSPDFVMRGADNSIPNNPSIQEKLKAGLRGVDVYW